MKTKKKSKDELDEINETGTRKTDNRRQDEAPVATERRKVQRRRLIDPTTCERDYTNDEIEFMQAMDEYKRKSGRMFPTCSEILEVLRDIGYVRTEIVEVEEEVTEEAEASKPSEEGSEIRTSAIIECELDQYEDEDFGDDDFDDDFDEE